MKIPRSKQKQKFCGGDTKLEQLWSRVGDDCLFFVCLVLIFACFVPGASHCGPKTLVIKKQ